MNRALVLTSLATVAVLAGCTFGAPSSQNANVAATPGEENAVGRGPVARPHSNPFVAELDWGSTTSSAEADSTEAETEAEETAQESTADESASTTDNNSTSNEPANEASPVDVGNSTAPYTNEPFPIQ